MAISQKVTGNCYNQGHQILLVIKKDTKQYVKLSFSNEKVANNNLEALQSLNVPIAQVNGRHSNSAKSKLTFYGMGGLDIKLFQAVGARVILT